MLIIFRTLPGLMEQLKRKEEDVCDDERFTAASRAETCDKRIYYSASPWRYGIE